MEMISSYSQQLLESTGTPAKRALSVEDNEELKPKRRLMSADEFCFSFEDLNRQLYSKHNDDDENFKENQEFLKYFCFWCDAKRFQKHFKCPYHVKSSIQEPETDAPQEQPKKLPYAFQDIPEILKLFRKTIADGEEVGIVTAKPLPAGAWVGPYEGTLVKIDEGVPVKKNNYMWEIFKDGTLDGYIDGSDENTASWMRFIRRANHKEEQNLYAFQYMNKIYYRTYKTIEPGQELLVWYDDMYKQYAKIPGNDPIKSMKKHTPPKYDFMATNNDAIHCQYTQDSKPRSETTDKQPSSPPSKSEAMTPPVVSHSVTMNKSIQMHTGFQGIGALFPSPTKSKGQATHEETPTTQSSNLLIAKPIALQSNGFSLKITDGHVASPTRSNLIANRSISPSPAVVPSPTSSSSPNTPLSNDSGFSFETVLEENSSKHESNETTVWRCGQCKKTFAQRAMLQVHVCSIAPFRPYRCGHCNESFSTSGEMRTHAVIHQRRKPFKCGYCSRSFSGATTLNNHIRIHTGEKPFKCEKCGKTFSQGTQLSKHENLTGDCLPKLKKDEFE